MNKEEKSLLKKIAEAVEQVEKGNPLKDFIDEDEILEALKLLMKVEGK